MAELVFTIFQGPNAGERFTLSKSPLTLGRDQARDVVLKDERASRLHARIALVADGAKIIDEGSSNGTFVNGVLVKESLLFQDDIIVIGRNSIILSPDSPTAERLARLERDHIARVCTGEAMEPTQLLTEEHKLKLSNAHMMEILEAVCDVAHPLAKSRGIEFHLKSEVENDLATVDANAIYAGLVRFLKDFLESLPPASRPDSESRAESILLMRLAAEPPSLITISIIAIGIPFERKQLQMDTKNESAAFLRRTMRGHGGICRIMPNETPGTIAFLRFPLETHLA